MPAIPPRYDSTIFGSFRSSDVGAWCTIFPVSIRCRAAKDDGETAEAYAGDRLFEENRI